MILTENGVLKLMQRIKSYIASQLNTKASSVHTHSISEIDNLASQLGGGYSKSEIDTLLNGKADTSHTHSKSQITDFPSYGTTANTICEGNDSRLSDARTPTSHTHTKSEITDFPTLATVATSGSYNDLTNKPTIPTKTSDLTNDSGFLTSSGSCNYANSAGTASSATTSGAVSTVVDNGSTKDLVYALIDTDAFRIRCSGFNNDSWVEIATSDDGNEPIYVRQYSWNGNTPGSFDKIVRTLTLLDGSGNTQFPGTVTASTFTGNLTGNVTGNCSGSAGSVAWSNVSSKPTIPTKVSDLTNDSNFVNSLNNYTSFSWDTPVSGKLNIKVDQTWLGGILTTANTTIPTNTSDLTNDSGFITADYAFPKKGGELSGTKIKRSTNSDHIEITGGTDYGSGPSLVLTPYNSTEGWQPQGTFVLHTNAHNLIGYPNGTLTWNNKNVAMQEDVIPRSGGAVITGNTIGRVDDDGYLNLCGGLNWSYGAAISITGKNNTNPGIILLHPRSDTQEQSMWLLTNGTWTWTGTACQLTSDQRYKQQITEIDNALLDAWEDVTLCQFKYNDAVEEKGLKARLHTGYVVQQIDDACKSHNIDISNYGLYCHEEYPQETEEVEVKQEDGTIKKETKVIREASEHYSLRYTEALIVECAYLRREINRLKEQMKK